MMDPFNEDVKDDLTLFFGKYKNMYIDEIQDKSYLLWLVKNDSFTRRHPNFVQPLWDQIKRLPKLEKK